MVPTAPSHNTLLAKKNVVKGCVSRGFDRTTFDHFFMANRVNVAWFYYVNSSPSGTSSKCDSILSCSCGSHANRVTVPHAAVVPGGILGRLFLISLLDVRREDVLSPLLPNLQHYVQFVQNLNNDKVQWRCMA